MELLIQAIIQDVNAHALLLAVQEDWLTEEQTAAVNKELYV